MSTRSIGLSDALHGYLLSLAANESPLLGELREETAKLPRGGMQIAPEQGRFMAWLVRLLGARRCLEVGVFTGYSSLSVAMALPPDGSLVACEVDEAWAAIAKRYWQRAGVESRVELVLGPALATLDALLLRGEGERFDFAFVDADKDNYPAYYERSLALVRPGGVVAFDNALWGGRVADVTVVDEETRAIRGVNERAARDPRVDATLVPIGDGLLMLRKR
ncbi:MAG TPA: class I SAM-dependent methyltransferase [Polyangiaceae bacterium]